MPRTAREKSDNSIFHIMIRSISEVNLFRTDKDKMVYLNLLKKYQNLYHFKIYAYCLMDNHAHLVIDVNGADISSIMHCTDFSYARYFNNSFFRLNVKRSNDEMAISQDDYLEFVNACNDSEMKDEIDFSGECSDYVSNTTPLIRNFDTALVISYVAKKTGLDSFMIYAKNNRAAHTPRAIAAFLLRSLCNCRCVDICRILGNITQSRASSLTRIGLDLVRASPFYKDMVDEFIITYSS